MGGGKIEPDPKKLEAVRKAREKLKAEQGEKVKKTKKGKAGATDGAQVKPATVYLGTDAPPKAAGPLGGVGRTDVWNEAVANHIKSFDYFEEHGLKAIVAEMDPVDIYNPDPDWKDKLVLSLVDVRLSKPTNTYRRASEGTEEAPRSGMRDDASRLYPAHCRLAHTSYAGELTGKFYVSWQGGPKTESFEFEASLGHLPVMVRSKSCHLHGLSPKDLVRRKEDHNEWGGYFLINGLERVIRMLLMPRANYVMALKRGSYKNRGKLYTDNATLMRAMRPDGTTQTNTLHFCRDGSCFLRFSHSKEEWLIPFVLAAKAMFDVSDGMLLDMLAGAATGGDGSIFLRERAFLMLQQQNAKQPVAGQKHALRLLGSTFRVLMGAAAPRYATDEEVGSLIVRKFFLVHTNNGWEKLQTFVLMYQKLIALVRGDIEPENQDSFSSHEILLPGQLYGMVVKESLEVAMLGVRGYIGKMVRMRGGKNSFEEVMSNRKSMITAVHQMGNVGKKVENFMATGNVSSRSGLDLMQISGYTIVADKLNMARFSSHFVAVHRGQYFAEMKTTTVRKLLPETWGFLCPVHTPDGSPCGLLNHLAHSCKGVIRFPDQEQVNAVMGQLASLGVDVSWRCTTAGFAEMPAVATGAGVSRAWVCVDGKPVGHIAFDKLEHTASLLRELKVAGKAGIPTNVEVVAITKYWKHLFPGLYIFLCPSRAVRPVRCLRSGKVEWIGPLEQLFVNVAVLGSEKELADAKLDGRIKDDKYPPEYMPVRYSHQELRPTEIFSVLASMTPFSNHNQSPRNMYQCQMLKQTMGIPYHNHSYRSDNKVYRIFGPQKPMVRTEMYDAADMDSHPQGTNAVVAVITYTGYDMEDAMIINKGSYDRGFAAGWVYKVKLVEAGSNKLKPLEQEKSVFSNISIKVEENGSRTLTRFCEQKDEDGEYKLQDDGLPRIGILLQKGDPVCCSVGHDGKPKIEAYKDEEPAFVENITRICGRTTPATSSRSGSERVAIKLRLTRRPMVGDKFSSRHGQKGVMSTLWAAEDMPFSDSGITPDILFNPHGFPSRMTIGMLIESIAGKTASQAGRPTADATTFRGYNGNYCEDDNEDDPFQELETSKGNDGGRVLDGPDAAEYFGHTLAKYGYQRLGTERMYSGIHGCEIETEIFLGVVYYQRLRHMVAEKAQVRARGPIDRITMQPLKGRKRHGGIRFGEMERDSLLAHGASYLLHDRLCRSSDYDIGFVCPMCGSIITPKAGRLPGDPWECAPCTEKTGQPVRCQPAPIPWVFRYLVCEMAAMNVKMQVKMANRGREASLAPVAVEAQMPPPEEEKPPTVAMEVLEQAEPKREKKSKKSKYQDTGDA
eukprot:TRINITY_DN30186_c0_g4_i1.p1 TRINITY_DN30186_c0_g4~~TRINITY_DN30186_c0_g4_i1.p1  ORF type:complete len:1347 (+),score=305.88 TRINITY_DN30186_c0_g4_i1:70-4110(+)